MRIHQALKGGGFPNATRLAADLEVSTKSVHRDLEFMRDRLDLPIEYDATRFGYFYTGEVNAFPTLQISEGELFALLVAEKALQQYRGTPFERPLVSAFRKMAAGLPDTVSLHLGTLEDTISFRTSVEPVLNLGVFDALAKAVASRRQLKIRYRKPGRAAGEDRVIDPLHLANINGEWYLYAFDHLRNSIRTFAPPRIQSVEPTGRTFERPARFSIENRLKGSFGVMSGDQTREVKVRFEPDYADYVRERRWHPTQSIEDQPDGSVIVRMNLSSLVEVARWILSWGGQAVALEPPDLVRDVSESIRRLDSAHHSGRPAAPGS